MPSLSRGSQLTSMPAMPQQSVWRLAPASAAGDAETNLNRAGRNPIAAGVGEQRFERNRLVTALIGTILALALAYLAQSFFDGESGGSVYGVLSGRLPANWLGNDRLNLGAALYLVSMILFAATALPLAKWGDYATKIAPPLRPTPYTASPYRPDARIQRPGRVPSPPPQPASPAQPAGTRERRTQNGVLIMTLAFYALAMIRFGRQGEDPLVRWLWAAALLVFVGGAILWPSLRREDRKNTDPAPRFTWQAAIVLALILVGAFWLRFNHLATLPSDFHGDMASHGLQAREILQGANRSLFREGWANMPMLAFVPASLSMRVFGDNLFGLNMTSVIGGILSILGLYLLAWRLFDSHRVAALAAAILAINTPHVHFSRIASYMDPWPFLLLGMFFLVDGLRARRNASFAAAGILIGLGFQMYYSGRIGLVFLIIAFLYLLIFQRQLLSSNLSGLALLAIGGLITFGPNLIYFAGNYEAFAERSRAVALFHPPVMEHLQGKYGVDSVTAVIAEQIRRSLLMFNHSQDSSTQFGYRYPMFISLLSPLVALGFGYGVRWWRRPQSALVLIWLLSILVMGSILTNNAPFWPRLVGILPAAALLAALVLDRLWENVWQLAGRRSVATFLLALFAAVLLLYAGWQNWTLYAQTVADNAHPQARVGRYLGGLPPEITACSLSTPDRLEVRETLFLAWPRTVVDYPADADVVALATCPGPPLVWVLGPNQGERLTQIQGLWPGGVVHEHLDANGALVFISYLVSDGEPIISPELSPSAPPTTGPGGYPPYLADGSVFAPEQEFFGSISGEVYEIPVGTIQVSDAPIYLQVGPVPGHDAVYDYVELRERNGAVIRVEAEASATAGDVYASNSGDDGHWWLQSYERFSDGRGLVAQKGEAVPVLTTTIPAPAGTYEVFIGSFTGDPANGVFALAIRWQ